MSCTVVTQNANDLVVAGNDWTLISYPPRLKRRTAACASRYSPTAPPPSPPPATPLPTVPGVREQDELRCNRSAAPPEPHHHCIISLNRPTCDRLLGNVIMQTVYVCEDLHFLSKPPKWGLKNKLTKIKRPLVVATVWSGAVSMRAKRL